MASQLAERTHRERLVLFLLQLFERLDPFDVLVVDVEDLALVKVFHLLLLLLTIIFIVLRLTVYLLVLVIVDKKFFVKQDLLSAGVPSVRYGETFLEAGWKQVEVFLAELEEHAESLLLGGDLLDAAYQQLIEGV